MGNIYGLIGTNGVGKTTLLEAINGTLRPDQGFIELNGAKIEMVYHDSGLFQEMTVSENMFLNRELYQRKYGLKAIDWSLMKTKTANILKSYGLDVPQTVRSVNLMSRYRSC